jgi:hypothetical protein
VSLGDALVKNQGVDLATDPDGVLTPVDPTWQSKPILTARWYGSVHFAKTAKRCESEYPDSTNNFE